MLVFFVCFLHLLLESVGVSKERSVYFVFYYIIINIKFENGLSERLLSKTALLDTNIQYVNNSACFRKYLHIPFAPSITNPRRATELPTKEMLGLIPKFYLHQLPRAWPLPFGLIFYVHKVVWHSLGCERRQIRVCVGRQDNRREFELSLQNRPLFSVVDFKLKVVFFITSAL